MNQPLGLAVLEGQPDYGVTPDGNVWSRARSTQWRQLSPSRDLQGRLKVNLRGRTRKVATLVAAAFLGPRPTGHDVDLLNGNQEDCSLANLAYRTRSENMRAAIREGRMAPPPAWVYGRPTGVRRKSSSHSTASRARRGDPAWHEKRISAALALGIRTVAGHVRYGVTEDGAVWSYARGNRWRKLVPVPCTRGLPKVKLGHARTVLVHELIAQAFLGRRPKGAIIFHIDGKRWNTAASNLKYVSKSADNLLTWAEGSQHSGWEVRRQRLRLMGHTAWGPNGSYLNGGILHSRRERFRATATGAQEARCQASP